MAYRDFTRSSSVLLASAARSLDVEAASFDNPKAARKSGVRLARLEGTPFYRERTPMEPRQHLPLQIGNGRAGPRPQRCAGRATPLRLRVLPIQAHSCRQ